MELTLVAAGPRVPPRLRALVAASSHRPLGLCVQECIQRLLDTAPHDGLQVVLDPLVINPNAFTNPWCYPLPWWPLAPSPTCLSGDFKLEGTRGHQPNPNVRRIFYVILLAADMTVKMKLTARLHSKAGRGHERAALRTGRH